MDAEELAFQQTVWGAHSRKPWAQRIRETLHFIKGHRHAIPFTGLVPSGPNSFLVKSDVCSSFFKIRRNSCNRNFQQDGFYVDLEANIEEELKQNCPELAGEKRHWVKRVFSFGLFNADSTPEEAELASAHARSVRRNRPFGVPQSVSLWREGVHQDRSAAVAPVEPVGETLQPSNEWAGGSGIDSDSTFSMDYIDPWLPILDV
jgi:hypothetical protein